MKTWRFLLKSSPLLCDIILLRTHPYYFQPLDLIDLPLCSDFSNSWFSSVKNMLLLFTHVMRIGLTHREKKLKVIDIICWICRRKDSIHVAPAILTYDLCSLHSHKQSLMKIRNWYRRVSRDRTCALDRHHLLYNVDAHYSHLQSGVPSAQSCAFTSSTALSLSPMSILSFPKYGKFSSGTRINVVQCLYNFPDTETT